VAVKTAWSAAGKSPLKQIFIAQKSKTKAVRQIPFTNHLPIDAVLKNEIKKAGEMPAFFTMDCIDILPTE